MPDQGPGCPTRPTRAYPFHLSDHGGHHTSTSDFDEGIVETRAEHASQHDGALDQRAVADTPPLESVTANDPPSESATTTAQATEPEPDLTFAGTTTSAAPDPERASLALSKDPNLVTWDGLADPAYPPNWPQYAKWTVTLLVSAFTFICAMTSSMLAPATIYITDDFDAPASLGYYILSSFILGYAFSPLFIGPVSEVYGRTRVLQLSNVVFLGFNLACGFATSAPVLIGCRVAAGFGGSGPLVVGGGVLGEVWRPAERGRAVAIYMLLPVVGHAVGPIAGGFVAQYVGWRWLFLVTSAVDGGLLALSLVFLRETYPPVLLQRKARRLRHTTGNPAWHAEHEYLARGVLRFVATAVGRPLRLLATQPMIQVLALYMGFLNGCLYLLITTFPLVWHGIYGETTARGSINYLSLGAGFALGTVASASLQTRIYGYLCRRHPVARPEFRVPLMLPGALLCPCGLLLYGWTAEHHVAPLVPNLGAALFAAGMAMGFQGIQTFVVDAYARYAASAMAAAMVVRNVGGFAFPLFGIRLFAGLGLGWGASVLAAVAAGIGLPAPLLLWRFGERLRRRSTFAAGGWEDKGR